MKYILLCLILLGKVYGQDVTDDMLRRWAANRVLADSLISEKALDFARASALVLNLTNDVKDIQSLLNTTNEKKENLIIELRETNKKLEKLENKIKRKNKTIWILALGAAIETIIIYSLLIIK